MIRAVLKASGSLSTRAFDDYAGLINVFEGTRHIALIRIVYEGQRFRSFINTIYFPLHVPGETMANTSGNIICTSQGITVALTVGGPFWATRIAGAAPGVGLPSPQPPTSGGRRKSEKLKAIANDIGSLF
jgi:hypothetical protein